MQVSEWVRTIIDDEIATVSRLRSSAHLDYPHHVHLETLAVCNAACGFCPYTELDRKGTRMPDALVEKIIDNLSAIPASVRFNLAPYKVNEPFLDKRLPDILAEVNARIPNADICLFSNGSAFTESNLRRAAKLKNVRYLVISLNDHRADAYFDLMKMPLARTLDRLQLLHGLVSAGEFPHPVIINRVMDGSDTDNQFVKWGEQTFPAFQTTLSIRKDWNGQVDERTTFQSAPNLPCRRWFDLSIMATGLTTMCCMDGKGEWTIGDANDQNVLDIYNAPAYKTVRAEAKSRHEIEACRTCTHL